MLAVISGLAPIGLAGCAACCVTMPAIAAAALA